MPPKPLSGHELKQRGRIPFGIYVGSAPPPPALTAHSKYSGLWEAIEELVILDQDTVINGAPVKAGDSPWVEIEAADRLEARYAMTSLHGYVRRSEANYELEVIYNDNNFSVHVRKHRKVSNGAA